MHVQSRGEMRNLTTREGDETTDAPDHAIRPSPPSVVASLLMIYSLYIFDRCVSPTPPSLFNL